MSLLSPNLLAFLAIVKNKTVQSAAKELGITQTGVTQRIRSLEASLNTSVFLRSRRGMLLTSEGQALLRYCQNAQDLEGETLSHISGAGETTEAKIKILGPTSIMRTRIVPSLIKSIQAFPKLLLDIDISDSLNAEVLKSGNTTFALLEPKDVALEMDSKLLKPESYVLVATKNWKNRILKDIVQNERIIDFNAKDSTTHNYLKKFHLLKFANPNRHFINNNEALLEMLEGGLGYGVLTKEFADLYLKRNNLILLNSGASLEHRLALAWYPRPQMPAYLKHIIDKIS